MNNVQCNKKLEWYRFVDRTKFEEANEVLKKRIGVKVGKNLTFKDIKKEVRFGLKGRWFVLYVQFQEIKLGNVLVTLVEAKYEKRLLLNLLKSKLVYK